MSTYFPSLKALLAVLNIKGDQLPADGTVKIPAKALKILIKHSLQNLELDEVAYISRNEDLKEAFLDKGKHEASRHFVDNGYFEGRDVPLLFDSAYYENSNADVALALKLGKIGSARDHFDNVGLHEWRSPSPEASAEVEDWKSLL